jgi:hypothetical protein
MNVWVRARQTGNRIIFRVRYDAKRGQAGHASALGAISSLSDEERYRKQAEDCRQMAAKAISPLDKEAWLKLAGDWLRLADDGAPWEKPR